MFGRNEIRRTWLVLVAAVLAWAWSGFASAQPAAPVWETSFAWKDAAVGKAVGEGKHAWNAKDGAMTLTGGGVGLNVKEADQCQFVYIDRPEGDFEIVVRLTDFPADEPADASAAGPADRVAGIMVRQAQGDSPNAAMTAMFYDPNKNALRYRSRIPAGKAGLAGVTGPWTNTYAYGVINNNQARTIGNGVELTQPGPADKAPVWLRMVRVGKNFAVYKSRDGRMWSMVFNISGGPVALEGPLRVGLFCSSGSADKTATATFDSIQIGDPHLRHKTSWVGGSFGGRVEDGHVSNVISAMWVAPDGTCYTSSYWDEGSHPVKAYRDGKPLYGLPVGTTENNLGGITGDGRHLFVAYTSHIVKLDLNAADNGFAPQPIVLSRDMRVRGTGIYAGPGISGMASNGKELFVADQRDNLIRVVTLEPMNTYASPVSQNNYRALVVPDPLVVAVPEGDDAQADRMKNFAPPLVYQSQRSGESFRYTFPNLTPGTEYTIRLHLAEFVKQRPANANPRNHLVTVNGTSINVAEEAGGSLTALVKDLPKPVKADDKGNVVLNGSTYGGPGVCGIEVLDTEGKRMVAVNCGGPAVGDFANECPELLDRNFAFENPGVMIFDKRGHLWIAQRLVEGVEGRTDTQGTVKCYTTDGKFTGRQLPGVTNPTALAYDAANDQLLVGEGIPDLNVRVYSNLDKDTPKLERTFGEKGGIYSGKTPGLVADPAAGGYARFAVINGLGVDAQGNLYVGGGWQGSDLRAFAPDGTFLWELHALTFCSTFDVDPASDGEDIYNTYSHIKLDLNKTQPGSEQTYHAYNWDLRRFGQPSRPGGAQAQLRRLGENKQLFLYTTGQGRIGDVEIFRYEGELAVPCGAIRENGTLWIDTDGDGKESPGEVANLEVRMGWHTCVHVDSRGDIWFGIVMSGDAGGSYLRRFSLKGFTGHGAPIYGPTKADFEDIRVPEEGGTTNAWGMNVRVDYNPDTDVMILAFPSEKRNPADDRQPRRYKLARYDHWSKGNRESAWKVDLPTPFDPATAQYFMYEKSAYPYSDFMTMQPAGDYVFFVHLFGEVHVFDIQTGEFVEKLNAGPEIGGLAVWQDATMGMRVFRRKNGEYLIFTENSGLFGKNNLYRWTPEKK